MNNTGIPLNEAWVVLKKLPRQIIADVTFDSVEDKHFNSVFKTRTLSLRDKEHISLINWFGARAVNISLKQNNFGEPTILLY